MTTRIPTLVGKPVEVERREAQIQDPFPDSDYGPETGFRPLNYQKQRAEPLRSKDRFFTSFIKRTRVTPMKPPAVNPGPAALFGPPPMAAYPPPPMAFYPVPIY